MYTHSLHVKGRVAICFHDMLVHRNNEKECYRKPISGNWFINYHSQYPLWMKVNLVFAWKDIVIKLSHISLKNTGPKRLKSILVKNSYPSILMNNEQFTTPHYNNNDNSIIENTDITHNSTREIFLVIRLIWSR